MRACGVSATSAVASRRFDSTITTRTLGRARGRLRDETAARAYDAGAASLNDSTIAVNTGSCLPKLAVGALQTMR
jgi:hypothetical protein